MSILKRATESTSSEWREIPEGLFRWVLRKPEVVWEEKFGNYRVKFAMNLAPGEAARIIADIGDPDEGVQQSTTGFYRTGLSLGYFKNGAYVSTKMVDFLAACVGSSNQQAFRKWMAAGNGPRRPDDPDDAKAEIELINDWLGWWEGLEVYGSIRHETGTDGKTYTRFGGPMAVGSLPGQKEEDYQAHAKGKLRAMMLECQSVEPPKPEPAKQELVAAGKPAKTYEEVFEPEDLPF